MAADPAALPVVGHQDHGGVLELATPLEERQELAHSPVRLGELIEVLGTPHAAYVTQLVGGQQLEHEQVGILLVHHAPRLGGQRVVDPARRLHRRHRPNHFFAKRIEQMRDPDKPSAAPVAFEEVEDRLAPHPEPRSEVRPHAVLGRRGAGEHRREAHDRPRRIGRLDRQVLGALSRKPIHHRSSRLPQPAPVAPVDDDHVHPPCPALGRQQFTCVPLRVARQVLREPARGQRAQSGCDRQRAGHARDRCSAPLLGEQGCAAQRDHELRDLLEGISARRVRVRQDESPEAEAVGPRRARAQVVVDRAPDHDGEERVAGQSTREQPRRPPRLEQRYGRERGEPQKNTSTQREREPREHDRHSDRADQRDPEPAVRRQPDDPRRQKDQQRIHDRKRPPLVEDVPSPGSPDLGEAGTRRSLLRRGSRREARVAVWLWLGAGHSRQAY